MIQTRLETAKSFPRRRDGCYYLDGNKALVEHFLAPKPLRHETFDSVTQANKSMAIEALNYHHVQKATEFIYSAPDKYDTTAAVWRAIKDSLESSAERGRVIHSLVEAFTRGASIDFGTVPEKYLGYARGFEKFSRTIEGFRVVLTEANVYNDTYGYAGTLDLVLEDPKTSLLIIYDFKTNKNGAVYIQASYQLAAYKHAEFVITRDNPPRVLPMPRVDLMTAIGLGPDGNYTPRTCTHELDDFLAVLRTYRNMKKWGA